MECYGSNSKRKKMIGGNEAAMKARFIEKLTFVVHQDEDVLF